jgi:outer membrane protein assembly factor BamB
LWSLPVRSIQTPWVAGDSVYVVDVSGKLMDVVRSSGEVRWTVKLPGEETWSGPVLAGNRLWLVSASGKLVGVDAATGKVTSQRDIGQKVFISPVVADGRMYVLTDKATLIAFN